MSQHMVIFQNPEGDPGYNQFESIDEAVSFVEKIRNEQSIDSIRIFELDEVKFDLKPYYKVELLALKSGAPAPTAAPSPAAPAPAPAPSAPAPAAAAPAAPAPSAPAPAAPAPSAPAPSAPSSGTEQASPFAPPAGPSEQPSGFPPPSGSPAAPTPPADQPDDQSSQPTRRGLFGR